MRNENYNIIIDNATKPITFEEIDCTQKKIVDVSQSEVVQWLIKADLKEFLVGEFIHKKGLEFFFSTYLLDIQASDIVLDAAGGKSKYLEAVKLTRNVKNLFLTDHIYQGIVKLDSTTYIVGGDISAIHLGNESVSKIACHHAFEHFQDNKDIDFVKECYRILKANGVVVIIPLFLMDDYIECWNIKNDGLFDQSAKYVFDQSASIPGADDDGHFARFYSNESLMSRILTPAQQMGFECSIIECTIDGQSIPDMSKNFGSTLNNPTRALQLKKRISCG